ncbi:EscU/YscU/HrcU family type III secretion system export apparatus switch protein [Legionella maioricensis]|uniref:Flagellar biosynthetic protein FlhB n=1 Tax=Legionella maioricensis TaxID=2896528 RepID=A0A9X2CXL4_9GAMM|nr:EscU/YscU/HrcU family type III secretion system export apparatus switch protein [Legionella maioricensis]MCL9682622.1 EscU/YscU/HrcU family type III secretion system export apparatus switch protein [Legionella maioricensis]MCL9687331.1 EscU/YscU/HrcU family type III secretion system export apparatus switch protein [Legionella maioricensis]
MTEKTEKATPYKLQKAKEKGQVSKSIELTTCISLLVMLGMITALWPKQLEEISSLFRHLLGNTSHFQFSVDNICHMFQLIMAKITTLWLPFALASGLTIILCTLAQTGMVWSTTPLIPDFKRLNFIQGCKKLFSMKAGFEAFKGTLKLALALLLLYFTFKHQVSSILQLGITRPDQTLLFMMSFIIKLIFQLLLVLTILAFLDKLYTQRKFKKDNRMSKQEVKDEYKQKEGDPKIKNKIKQLQNQLRQKTASLKLVKTADVIITNPTHLAIALKYERHVMPAPKVVCKARGEMVAQIKEIAKKHGIPIIENKAFARMLYQSIELNQWISKDLFPIAASIFRDIYRQRNHK